MQFDLRANDCQQAFILPRLLDEVARAAAHSFDRQPNVAPCRHNNHGQVAVVGDDLRKEVEAFLARRGVARVVQVDQDRIVRFAGERFAHCGRRLRGIDDVAFGAQQQFDGLEDMRLIVRGENAGGSRRFLFSDLFGEITLCLGSGQRALPQARCHPPRPALGLHYPPE